MVDVTDQQFEQAEARSRAILKTEPRALSARYDKGTGRVVLELASGCTYIFPKELVQDLEGASDDVLSNVHVDGAGFNLHFPVIDVDLHVPALVSGVFGTRAWMASTLARMAGQTKSPAKSASARVNGAKGGRPRKTA